jgi:hypothetical protein
MQKDAESQFQQLETKEGPLLQMEDYAFFRFKYSTFSQVLKRRVCCKQKSVVCCTRRYVRSTLLMTSGGIDADVDIFGGGNRWWINNKSRMYVLENTGNLYAT